MRGVARTQSSTAEESNMGNHFAVPGVPRIGFSSLLDLISEAGASTRRSAENSRRECSTYAVGARRGTGTGRVGGLSLIHI
eukprot:3320343-Rhodomonas_salina.1